MSLLGLVMRLLPADPSGFVLIGLIVRAVVLVADFAVILIRQAVTEGVPPPQLTFTVFRKLLQP